MPGVRNRREFLGSSALFGLAAASSAFELSDDDRKGNPDMIPVIDTHQHLWDLSRFRLPWVKEGDPLAKNFLLDEYRQATAGLNIAKAIYMEVDVDPSQQTQEAEWIIDICQRKAGPTVAAVISGRPDAENFKNYVTNYRNNPYVKGVRRILHSDETPPGHCLDPKFINGVQLLGDLGLSFDLCMRPGELMDADKLVAACPDTRFILDHCGNGSVQAADLSPWKRGMEAIAKRKNVVCKVSGFIVTAKPYAWKTDELAPIVNHTIDVFGPDRIMFGGDWPVCTLAATYRQWFNALQEIVSSRPEQLRRNLFHDNALRYYGLANA